jgi:hypothetical protein
VSDSPGYYSSESLPVNQARHLLRRWPSADGTFDKVVNKYDSLLSGLSLKASALPKDRSSCSTPKSSYASTGLSIVSIREDYRGHVKTE